MSIKVKKERQIITNKLRKGKRKDQKNFNISCKFISNKNNFFIIDNWRYYRHLLKFDCDYKKGFFLSRDCPVQGQFKESHEQKLFLK